MAQETSSLEIEPDFNHTEVRLTQRPLVGWGLFAFLSIWPTLFFGSVLAALLFDNALVEKWGEPIFVLFMLGAAGFFAVSLFWKRTSTVSIGRHQVRIDAWTGLLARPARLTLPLDRLRLKHRSNLEVNDQKVYRLTLTSPGGETHRIGAIACTDEDLQTLTSVIEEAQRLSLPDAGTDADVPDQLRTTMGTAGKQTT